MRLGKAVDVSSIGRSFDTTLDLLPNVANSRRDVCVAELSISPGGELGDGVLHEVALGVADTEENSVDDEKNPGTLGKGNSRAKNAEKEYNLKSCNKHHARVIVFLDETTNGVRNSTGLRVGTGSLGLKGREEVGACVGSNVEDGIDGKWENGK